MNTYLDRSYPTLVAALDGFINSSGDEAAIAEIRQMFRYEDTVAKLQAVLPSNFAISWRIAYGETTDDTQQSVAELADMVFDDAEPGEKFLLATWSGDDYGSITVVYRKKHLLPMVRFSVGGSSGQCADGPTMIASVTGDQSDRWGEFATTNSLTQLED